jgi:ABC-type nitrate/sulfonate/bicarbonate transport system substrate-binding protein
MPFLLPGYLRRLAILALAAPALAAQSPAQRITIHYPARTSSNWAMWIAREGGYYHKYGLEAALEFGVHPAGIAMLVSGGAVMTNYSLEQTLQAGARDGSLVALGSPYRKSLFALMAARSVPSVAALKGKRIGVSQIGDTPYNYALGLLAKFGLGRGDVEWVPIGTDVNGRAAALVAGRVDATMLTAPAYFRLEQQGFRSLANISDYEDIYAPTVYLFKRSVIQANPTLPERLLRAHTEATRRLYSDKAFAVAVYGKYSPEPPADVDKVYDLYTRANTFERVPYIPAAAVEYALAHPPDEQTAAQWKTLDARRLIDNSLVDRLAREGFFEAVFGAGIRAELAAKAKLAFR